MPLLSVLCFSVLLKPLQSNPLKWEKGKFSTYYYNRMYYVPKCFSHKVLPLVVRSPPERVRLHYCTYVLTDSTPRHLGQACGEGEDERSGRAEGAEGGDGGEEGVGGVAEVPVAQADDDAVVVAASGLVRVSRVVELFSVLAAVVGLAGLLCGKWGVICSSFPPKKC